MQEVKMTEEDIAPFDGRRVSVEQKWAYCTAWEKSGLTQAQFCKEKNISIELFKYWHRLYKKAKQSKSSPWVPVVTKPAVPLPIAPPEAVLPPPLLQLELAFPNQLVVRVGLPASQAVPFLQEVAHAIAVVR